MSEDFLDLDLESQFDDIVREHGGDSLLEQFTEKARQILSPSEFDQVKLSVSLDGLSGGGLHISGPPEIAEKLRKGLFAE